MKSALILGAVVVVAAAVAWRLASDDSSKPPAEGIHPHGDASKSAAPATPESPRDSSSAATSEGAAIPVARTTFNETPADVREVELAVVGPDGAPAPGAEVRCVAFAPATSRPASEVPRTEAAPTIRTVVADASGRAKIPWRDGRVRCSGKAGRLRGTTTFSAEDVAAGPVLKLAARTPVTVVEATGRPAVDALVGIFYGEDAAPGEGARSRTDRDGVAAFDGRSVRAAAALGRRASRDPKAAKAVTTARVIVPGLHDDELPSAPFPETDDAPLLRIVLPTTGDLTVRVMGADGLPLDAVADVFVFAEGDDDAESAVYGDGDPLRAERVGHAVRTVGGAARFPRIAAGRMLRIAVAFAEPSLRRVVVDREGPAAGATGTIDVRCGGAALVFRGRFVNPEGKPERPSYAFANPSFREQVVDVADAAAAEEATPEALGPQDHQLHAAARVEADGRFAFKFETDPKRYARRDLALYVTLDPPRKNAETSRPFEIVVRHGPPNRDGVVDLGDVVIGVVKLRSLATGVVVDGSGRPVAGADVALYRRERPFRRPDGSPGLEGNFERAWEESVELTRTDREGRFDLKGPENAKSTTPPEDAAERPLHVGARKKGWMLTAPAPYAPGARDVRVVMDLGGGVAGSLVYPDLGAPGDSSPFSVRISGPAARGEDVNFDSLTGDAKFHVENGRFAAYALPPGPARVAIMQDGRDTPLLTVDLVVVAGQVVRDPRLQEVDLLKLVAVRRVRVVDPEGRGLRGAVVHASTNGEDWTRSAAGADGVALVPLIEGDPAIVVTHEGYRGVDFGTLKADAVVTLKRGGPIKLVVRIDPSLEFPAEPRCIEVGVMRVAKGAGEKSPWSHPLADWRSPVRVGAGGVATFFVREPGLYRVELSLKARPDAPYWLCSSRGGEIEIGEDAKTAEIAARPTAASWRALLDAAAKPDPADGR